MVALDISHASRSRFSPDSPARALPRRVPSRRGAKHPGGPVVPQSVKGRYRTIKWAMLALCLAVYGLLPFLRWDRGPGNPDQAVLVDFVRGRLFVFFIEIWPQEFYLITGLLVLSTIVLILVNSLAGRLWCGFACPQTVWTDLFLAVERLVEGDRRDRLRKRGEARMSLRRMGELALKHTIWLAISTWTGAGLIFYFADAPSTLHEVVTGNGSLLAYSWVGIIGAITYTLAGFAREQMCTSACPWPRLQGAIWDPEALTVNYRDHRGEVRMSAKKAEEARARGEAAGDCVDCNQCVAVCPMGIDIRQGPNFACINCGLCVDACDSVMGKLGRDRGLIDFEAWVNIERGRIGAPQARRLVRPKTVGLAAAALLLSVGMGGVLASRSSGSLFVQHDRNPLAVTMSDGSIMNGYTLRITNKSGAPRSFTVSATGIAGMQTTLVGQQPVHVPADGTAEVRLTIAAGAEDSAPVHFDAVDDDGHRFTGNDRFVVP